MPTVKSKKPPAPPADPDAVFDDFDKLLDIAQRSFAQAKVKAIDENDRLGVPNHGARDGKIIIHPPRKPSGHDKA